MQIYKCDRCKEIIDKDMLLSLQVINYNEEAATKFPSFLGDIKQYASKTWELCPICVEQILHFLAHPENILR